MTIIKIDNTSNREMAENKIKKLKNMEWVKNNYHNFEFLICPAGGSFDIYISSDYEFENNAEFELLDSFTSALIASL